MTTSLEQLLLAAVEGDRTAAERFLELFLAQSFFVPERRQAQKMSDQPNYPNEFLNMLGIQDKERVVVPLFTRQELIAEWCGNTLAARSMKTSEILNHMPEDWWICVNPAAEAEKEISPWEIELLRGGAANIPAILDELYQHTIVEPLEVQPVQTYEYEALHRELKDYASRQKQIEKLYLIRQTGKDIDETIINKLLLGAEISTDSEGELENIKQELQALADRCQVGGDKVTLFSAQSGKGDMSFGLFGKSIPFYTRENRKRSGTLLERLFRRK
jgi:hypothetical protein